MWDETDATADPYLHAAILLGLGLATRGKTVGDQGDLEALRDIEGRIEDELRRLEKMEKHNEGIRKNSDGIADEIRKAQRQLDLLLRNAKSTLSRSTSSSTRRTSNDRARSRWILLLSLRPPPRSIAYRGARQVTGWIVAQMGKCTTKKSTNRPYGQRHEDWDQAWISAGSKSSHGRDAGSW